jgi:hypothetical protein
MSKEQGAKPNNDGVTEDPAERENPDAFDYEDCRPLQSGDKTGITLSDEFMARFKR